ncbi:MAG: type I methionyl aminopeptidase [Bacteroidetes bacterium]|nr:type I methionyl aminopeptidase [Bacteroidota bacterium]
MIYYKTDEEIELIRESALLVCKAHAAVASIIRPGIQTKELDKVAEACIRDHGGVPGFLGLYGFPATLCISVNEEIVHGFPSEREILPGDIISVDCGVLMNSFYGDVAFTYPIGEISEENRQLLKVTNESLYKGIEQAVVGNRLGDIGYAIQQHTEKLHGYGVVRDLVGHGLGRELHEEPQVPNYGRRGRGIKLQDGLVIAIEPMINLGTHRVIKKSDGWTIVSADNKCSAHFEHTLAVRAGKADVLSNHEYIFDALKSNPEIQIFK